MKIPGCRSGCECRRPQEARWVVATLVSAIFISEQGMAVVAACACTDDFVVGTMEDIARGWA